MTNAQYEQTKFWSIFDNKLVENGEPFEIIHEKSGEVTYWGNVNKNNSFVSLCLNIEFQYRAKKVRVGIYIRDDLYLFKKLQNNRETIDEQLGFKPDWVLEGKTNPNTRRIINEFPVIIGNLNDYDRVIDEILPYIMQYKKVFEKYIPNLCDF